MGFDFVSEIDSAASSSQQVPENSNAPYSQKTEGIDKGLLEKGRQASPAPLTQTPIAAIPTSKSQETLLKTPSHQNLVDLTNDLETFPCKVCNTEVDDDPLCIACDACNIWLHFKCCGLTESEHEFLTGENLPACVKYLCPVCLNAPLQNIDFSPNARLDKQDLAIQTLSDTVKALQVQNENILSILKGPSLENKVQVQVNQVYEDQREKEEKKNNIILFNVPETENREPIEGVRDDADLVREILTHVSPDISFNTLDAASITRLGALREENARPRPIKVKLTYIDHKFKLLKACRNLTDYKRFSKIGLSKDKTKFEMIEDKRLKDEVEKRKRDDPNADPVIFRGKVMERKIRDDVREKERTEVKVGGIGSASVAPAGAGASYSDVARH